MGDDDWIRLLVVNDTCDCCGRFVLREEGWWNERLYIVNCADCMECK